VYQMLRLCRCLLTNRKGTSGNTELYTGIVPAAFCEGCSVLFVPSEYFQYDYLLHFPSCAPRLKIQLLLLLTDRIWCFILFSLT
jgi:hypothetical protein